MHPNPDISVGSPGGGVGGETYTGEPSPWEARAFKDEHFGAPAGRFGIASFRPPPGVTDNTWGHRIVGERDCSRLPDRVAKIASGLGEVEETVIDSVIVVKRNANGAQASRRRTVTAHVGVVRKSEEEDEKEHVMLEIERVEEKGLPDVASVVEPVLDEFLARAKRHGIGVSGSPLIGLDPELANPDERRTLVKERIPYVLLLDHFFPFRKVLWPLEDDWDVIDEIAAEDLFDVYKPDREIGECNLLGVADLVIGSSESGRVERESLVEVLVHDQPVHFLVWPGLPREAKDHEHRDRAIEMAERAARLLLDGPLCRMRGHEFQHRYHASYCKALWIVQYGLLV